MDIKSEASSRVDGTSSFFWPPEAYYGDPTVSSVLGFLQNVLLQRPRLTLEWSPILMLTVAQVAQL